MPSDKGIFENHTPNASKKKMPKQSNFWGNIFPTFQPPLWTKESWSVNCYLQRHGLIDFSGCRTHNTPPLIIRPNSFAFTPENNTHVFSSSNSKHRRLSSPKLPVWEPYYRQRSITIIRPRCHARFRPDSFAPSPQSRPKQMNHGI